MATSFSLTFYVTDGTNTANTICSFELSFIIANSKYSNLLMSTDGLTGDNNDIEDSSSSDHTITAVGDALA